MFIILFILVYLFICLLFVLALCKAAAKPTPEVETSLEKRTDKLLGRPRFRGTAFFTCNFRRGRTSSS
ncbi:MAG: hypothetical protein A2836_01355 [Candidatus Taylorbacteria bacterium RIFCSPHIGHO2_01_FULL_45_63]|uniref:Uncharacterized protein n=1 Tax=Candidatus Taylorbacteria bacterium RIFCSPHIGHO2_02_FULL_45_35 TaxID=1802311 RepID=A0A1G2MW09_9BACT|nr:MAG: hypothetical protein A2836_01355 [Candidatus Taylorbacteria bacterium RIFCSPHIGHO2_01_FULL_45_63]OHA28058.1 MAG: hypothetical protein A3D56_00060 [Candidatus Taylorbacteria bacterium RIFCSPHIGHO2_02_FULL_45_35]OHA34883.1 MAG: hypothetical protein A3A22_02855 [Candidatus Taylorbacteria bacterium RIFCSPLOWO2_01_FULL_45_34b]